MDPFAIRTYPDEILRAPCAEVTTFDSKLRSIVDQMALTMRIERGIGLAAPQVGISKLIAVVDVSEEGDALLALVNPKIISKAGKVPSEEGCLSIPGYRDTISRAKEIVVQFQDLEGKQLEIKADALMSICIQHEIDHLHGVLFVDHLSRLKRELFKRWLRKEGLEFSPPAAR